MKGKDLSGKRMLHPGVKWSFRIGGYFLFGFLGMFFGLWFLISIAIFLKSFIIGFVLFLFFVVLVVVLLSEVYAQMSYNRWFYEFTSDGLKFEHGIIWKRYANVPYERVQNVDIRRGIIARMFGFSTVLIQTAGYSAQGYVEGGIPGVDINEAEKIREFVMKKISKGKSGGLG